MRKPLVCMPSGIGHGNLQSHAEIEKRERLAMAPMRTCGFCGKEFVNTVMMVRKNDAGRVMEAWRRQVAVAHLPEELRRFLPRLMPEWYRDVSAWWGGHAVVMTQPRLLHADLPRHPRCPEQGRLLERNPMTQNPCNRECLIRSKREDELRISAGAYRGLLADAVTKLEAAGVDAFLYKIFLRDTHDVGATQHHQNTLNRESMEAARSAVWYLEHYMVQMRKELARKGLIDPADRDVYDELGSLHAQATEKLALFRGLDNGLCQRHQGDLATEAVPGANPAVQGLGVKLARAARALLSMDAYIHRLRQAYYAGNPEIRNIAIALLNHVGSDALEQAYHAYAALGINGEWCGDNDRRPHVQTHADLATRYIALEELSDRLAVEVDDLRAENERLRAKV